MGSTRTDAVSFFRPSVSLMFFFCFVWNEKREGSFAAISRNLLEHASCVRYRWRCVTNKYSRLRAEYFGCRREARYLIVIGIALLHFEELVPVMHHAGTEADEFEPTEQYVPIQLRAVRKEDCIRQKGIHAAMKTNLKEGIFRSCFLQGDRSNGSIIFLSRYVLDSNVRNFWEPSSTLESF